MAATELKKTISAERFVRRFKRIMEEQQGRFAFFIGAGCSQSSGISTAGELGLKWLHQLVREETGADKDHEAWAASNLPDFDASDPARAYPSLMERLFLRPVERQREIEALVGNAYPGFGYAVLAKLITTDSFGRYCNVVLTTNFDDMVADALYIFGRQKPLVMMHDSLASFVEVGSRRPLIMKLHGDARLAPRNTEQETAQLDAGVTKVLGNLLPDLGLIFIGYGGNDKSIVYMLSGLPKDAPKWGVYWVSNRIPQTPFGAWLAERGAIWVKHLDFDALMLLVRREFGLDHPDIKQFEAVMKAYRDTFDKLSKEVRAREDTAEKAVLTSALDKAAAEFKDWWSAQLEADKFATSEPDKADGIYRQGLERFPTSHEWATTHSS